MADGRVLNSSVSCRQNYPPSWDLHEMIRYKEEKCFSYDGKRIKSLDTLEMLKIFTKNVVGQLGHWLSLGGRYKKFVSSNSDLILTWNYDIYLYRQMMRERIREPSLHPAPTTIQIN